MNAGLWFALACGAFALLYGGWSIKWILAQPAGNERMREISAAIQEGASAYLNKQYTTIGIVGVVIFLIIGFTLGWLVAVGFLIAGEAGDQVVPVVSQIGILLLWLSALLTLYTGYDYMRAGLRYMMDD